MVRRRLEGEGPSDHVLSAAVEEIQERAHVYSLETRLSAESESLVSRLDPLANV